VTGIEVDVHVMQKSVSA